MNPDSDDDPAFDSVQVDGRGPVGKLFRAGKPGEGRPTRPFTTYARH